jgi:hypothetical protein
LRLLNADASWSPAAEPSVGHVVVLHAEIESHLPRSRSPAGEVQVLERGKRTSGKRVGKRRGTGLRGIKRICTTISRARRRAARPGSGAAVV